MEDDANSSGLSTEVDTADAAVVIHSEAEQPIALDVDPVGDVARVRILKSHANENTVGAHLTVSAVTVSKKPHSVEARSDILVQLDGNNFSS